MALAYSRNTHRRLINTAIGNQIPALVRPHCRGSREDNRRSGVRDTDGKPYTVRYDAVNAMLLNEFLKEH